MIIFLIIFALLAGMALPTQFSVNAQLRSVVHSLSLLRLFPLSLVQSFCLLYLCSEKV